MRRSPEMTHLACGVRAEYLRSLSNVPVTRKTRSSRLVTAAALTHETSPSPF